MDYIDIFIKNDYINLKQIAESGQCFRWKKMCPGRYFVISDGRAACFFQEKTGIRILCRSKDEEYFRRYLDLDTDYGKVSYVRFHMLFGFPPASDRESVPLACPRCRP
mgnify:CR=1 FL=1